MAIEDYFYSSLSDEEIEANVVGAVVWNRHIELTPDQRATARENIGAGQENRNFTILAYFRTLEELRASLTTPPTTGDAYGIGTGWTYSAVPQSDLEENPAEAGYYIFTAGSYVPTTDTAINPVATYYEYVYDEDQGQYVYSEVELTKPNPSELGYYVNIDGVYALTEDVVPMAGTIYYEYVVEPGGSGSFIPVTIDEPNPSEMGLYVFVSGSYMHTSDTTVVPGITYYVATFVPYDIYVWDALHGDWINNGPLSTAADVIDDGADDVYHVLSSKKTREMCDEVANLMINTNRIVNNAVTADKILNNAVSHFYTGTIGTSWLGKNASQLLSPDGENSDYIITYKPAFLISVEEVFSGIFLEEGTDYTYDAGTGTFHFVVKPELGNETHKVTYPTDAPPYRHTVSVPGMLETDHPIVDINPSDDYETADLQLDTWADIYKTVAAQDSLIVYSHHKTTRDILIQIICIRK